MKDTWQDKHQKLSSETLLVVIPIVTINTSFFSRNHGHNSHTEKIMIKLKVSMQSRETSKKSKMYEFVNAFM
jgi:hypothetical protein